MREPTESAPRGEKAQSGPRSVLLPKPTRMNHYIPPVQKARGFSRNPRLEARLVRNMTWFLAGVFIGMSIVIMFTKQEIDRLEAKNRELILSSPTSSQ